MGEGERNVRGGGKVGVNLLGEGEMPRRGRAGSTVTWWDGGGAAATSRGVRGDEEGGEVERTFAKAEGGGREGRVGGGIVRRGRCTIWCAEVQ